MYCKNGTKEEAVLLWPQILFVTHHHAISALVAFFCGILSVAVVVTASYKQRIGIYLANLQSLSMERERKRERETD